MRYASRVIGLLVAMAFGVGVASAARAEEGAPKPPKPSTISGTVKKLEGRTLTIAGRKEGAADEKQVTVTDATQFVVETDEDESFTGEGGNTRTRPKTREGVLSDLKEGMRVGVTYADDGSATKIVVPRAAKKGGDGDKEKGK